MSFFDCVQRAIDDNAVGRQFGKDAQARWAAYAKLAENNGSPRHVAEQIAAQRVKTELAAETAQARHENLARLGFMQRAHFDVMAATGPDSTARMTAVDNATRSIERLAHGQLVRLYDATRTNVLSQGRSPATEADMVRAIYGEPTTTPDATAMGSAVTDTLESLRLQANEAGATIGKLNNYFPQEHNRQTIMRSGFNAYVKAQPEGFGRTARAYWSTMRDPVLRRQVQDRAFTVWFDEIDPRMNWKRIKHPITGEPISGGAPSRADRERFLREVFQNIVFGRASRKAEYGRPGGQATARRISAERILHFKSADDWLAYNKVYGTGGPMRSLYSHIGTMAKDIALMREFGPSPSTGLDYRTQLFEKKAADAEDVAMLDLARRDGSRAQRMMNVLNGPDLPNSQMQQASAIFFASSRQVLGGSLLERAVVMAIPDLANTRMAAKAVGMNPENVVSKYLGFAKSLSREELLQHQWIADTAIQPGATQARFSQELGAAEWAQKYNNASMRVQGLAALTDWGRRINYQEFGAHLSNMANRPMAQLPPFLQKHFETHGITTQDWDRIRLDPDAFFVAENGARFLMPVWWRSGTKMPPKQADDLFIKMQSAVEHHMELAIPTRSLFVDSMINPTAYGLTPGAPMYELVKSPTMFKSFVGAITMNIAHQWRLRPTKMTKWMYLAEHAATAAMLAAVSLQLKELLKGNDPRDMTAPGFWFQALVAGGGLAIAGDLLFLGTSPNGMSLTDFVTGPVVAAGTDLVALTAGNLSQAMGNLMAGEPIDTNAVPELRRFMDRYMIAEPPFLGPAFDRLVLDQMQILLDPESRTQLLQQAQRQQQRHGNESWWLPGSPLPSRAPSLEGQGNFLSGG